MGHVLKLLSCFKDEEMETWSLSNLHGHILKPQILLLARQKKSIFIFQCFLLFLLIFLFGNVVLINLKPQMCIYFLAR